MKDSWLLYDYLQRWWRVLLLCSTLGILGAYLMNEPTVRAKEYSASATLAFIDPMPDSQLIILHGSHFRAEVLVTIESGLAPTQGEAQAAINTKFSKLSEYSGNPVVLREIVIQEDYQDNWAWWKGVTFGAVIGLLAAIGMIYVWTDIQTYVRREQAAQSQ